MNFKYFENEFLEILIKDIEKIEINFVEKLNAEKNV